MANRSVFVGSLSENVTEDLLYELFLQAGPVANVKIPTLKGKPSLFGFVEFMHPCSVQYAIGLLDGISLFGRKIRVNLPLSKGAAPPRETPTLPDYHSNLFRPMLPPVFHPEPVMMSGGYNYVGEDLRERLGGELRSSSPAMAPVRSRPPNKHMKPKPSKRSKRSRAANSPPPDLDAIPDFLDTEPFFNRREETHSQHNHRQYDHRRAREMSHHSHHNRNRHPY